ncbi:MAG: helix-turn-helix domain-containing protein [Flavobacteriaceae bacterium]|nr:helix-turn-helix domain-containing protein [Flavobacteriaceae bacterium]
MKTLKQLERLRKIHQYIKASNAGTPKEFASKLNISESQLYNVLEDLKIKGFPIVYSRTEKTYLYNNECELEIHYSVELLTAQEKINIAGGTIENFFTPMQLEWTGLHSQYQSN